MSKIRSHRHRHGAGRRKGSGKGRLFRPQSRHHQKEAVYGGAEVVTGTLPSKLKETAIFLSGKLEKGLYGVERGLEHEASVEDFMYRKNFVSASAAQEIYENLMRHGVAIFHGIASFEDPHTIKIKGEKEELIYGENIIIATGSYPYHPANILFDGKPITIPIRSSRSIDFHPLFASWEPASSVANMRRFSRPWAQKSIWSTIRSISFPSSTMKCRPIS